MRVLAVLLMVAGFCSCGGPGTGDAGAGGGSGLIGGGAGGGGGGSGGGGGNPTRDCQSAEGPYVLQTPFALDQCSNATTPTPFTVFGFDGGSGRVSVEGDRISDVTRSGCLYDFGGLSSGRVFLTYQPSSDTFTSDVCARCDGGVQVCTSAARTPGSVGAQSRCDQAQGAYTLTWFNRGTCGAMAETVPFVLGAVDGGAATAVVDGSNIATVQQSGCHYLFLGGFGPAGVVLWYQPATNTFVSDSCELCDGGIGRCWSAAPR